LGLCLIFEQSSFANNSNSGGTTIGNGGDVVLKDGGIFMLDLVEAGIEKGEALWNPSKEVVQALKLDLKQHCFNPDLCFDLYLHNNESRLATILARSAIFKQNPELAVSLANLLNRIKAENPELESILFSEFSRSEWKKIDAPLTDIPDAITVIDKKLLRQGAINRNGVIFINSLVWDKTYTHENQSYTPMDTHNQLGLVVHEIVYSYTFKNGDSSSERARKATALLIASKDAKTQLSQVIQLLREQRRTNLATNSKSDLAQRPENGRSRGRGSKNPSPLTLRRLSSADQKKFIDHVQSKYTSSPSLDANYLSLYTLILQTQLDLRSITRLEKNQIPSSVPLCKKEDSSFSHCIYLSDSATQGDENSILFKSLSSDYRTVQNQFYSDLLEAGIHAPNMNKAMHDVRSSK